MIIKEGYDSLMITKNCHDKSLSVRWRDDGKEREGKKGKGFYWKKGETDED